MGNLVATKARSRSLQELVKRSQLSKQRVAVPGHGDVEFLERPADPGEGRGATLVVMGDYGTPLTVIGSPVW